MAKRKVKQITLGPILGWFFGLVFALLGVIMLLGGELMAGLPMLIMAAVLLPPLNNIYEKKFNFKLSGGLKAVIVIISFIIFVFAAQPEPVCGDNVCNGVETCSSCSIDCGRCAADIAQEEQAKKQANEQAIEDMKKSVVLVKYEVTGKNGDGSYIDTYGTGSGVITSVSDSSFTVYTNRHLVDCGFTKKCYQKLTEKITIRTHDGITYTSGPISVLQHNLDIARLVVKSPNANRYKPVKRGEAVVGEPVIAVGYSSYKAGNVLEFSVAKGTVSAKKSLMTDDGFSFNSFDFNALTSVGSSGGGLFNNEGELIGFNTWNQGTYSGVISASDVLGFYLLNFCNEGWNFGFDGKCTRTCKKSQILDSKGQCIDRCTTFYCNGAIPYTYKTEACGYRNRYTLGTDGVCHQTCGLRTSWCSPGAYCLSNKCTSCKLGSKLYKNGYCAKWEDNYAYT